MSEAFDSACRRLRELFEDSRESPEPHGRLNGVVWTLRDAPSVGLAIADEAVQRLELGSRLLDEGDDLASDAYKSFVRTQDCYWRSQFALESSVRYLHSSADLLAQFINHALALNIPEARCDLSGVKGKLAAHVRYAAVEDALTRLSESEEFEYVADLANRSKHRRNAPGGIHAKLNDSGGVEVSKYLGAFEHGTRLHPKIEAEELAQKVESLQEMAARVLDLVAIQLVAEAKDRVSPKS
jgi:hypothetical protein